MVWFNEESSSGTRSEMGCNAGCWEDEGKPEDLVVITWARSW